MDAEFRKLISLYHAASQEMFSEVIEHLGIEKPRSGKDWVFSSIEQIGATQSGISYFKHGIGIDMRDGARSISLDIGENGEIDGFSPGFLEDFYRDNKLDISLSRSADIREMVQAACKQGDLWNQPDSDLYFLVPTWYRHVLHLLAFLLAIVMFFVFWRFFWG